MTINAVLGEIKPHWAGIILGTGYETFNSPCGISGLAKENGIRLDILAVNASNLGSGQFRQFVALAKDRYQEIYVWEVWNPTLEQVLLRYGFKPAKELQLNGEELTGFKWTNRNGANP